MNKMLKFVLLMLLFVPAILQAQDIPSRPNPPKLVNDLANVLSPEEELQLEQKLKNYDDTTFNQVAIVTVTSLNDYPIEEYSLKLFRDWGIGNKTTNNGVLILAVIQDRKIRIEPGYGLEGAIPDITASQIITSDIVPAFREERYFDGLNAATNSIIAAAAGEYKAPENYSDRGKKRNFPVSLVVVVIILIILFSNRNRGGGGGFLSRRGYRGGLGPIFFPGGGGSSWGGGGFSGGGGGFGGFGGGSSGGGGASGSW